MPVCVDKFASFPPLKSFGLFWIHPGGKKGKIVKTNHLTYTYKRFFLVQ